MFRILRSLLFLLPAETAHYFSLNQLTLLCRIPGFKAALKSRIPVNNELETEIFGIRFVNPVGLGAGFDKNARYLHLWPLLGFGHVEIGTVTPRPQPGNPKPRLFRLPKDEAVINRMGFNNDGAAIIAERLRNRPEGLVVGGNIGKNKDTPNADAATDYRLCAEILHEHVDYFTINVSSPNTPGLRELQERDSLESIIRAVQSTNEGKSEPKPVLLKIAPDMERSQIEEICGLSEEMGLNGLILNNTTISRKGLNTSSDKVKVIGPGGLSGAPLRRRSLEVLELARSRTSLPIIGIGGINATAVAEERFRAGADLVQLWTGFVYEGPALLWQILRAFRKDWLRGS